METHGMTVTSKSKGRKSTLNLKQKINTKNILVSAPVVSALMRPKHSWKFEQVWNKSIESERINRISGLWCFPSLPGANPIRPQGHAIPSHDFCGTTGSWVPKFPEQKDQGQINAGQTRLIHVHIYLYSINKYKWYKLTSCLSARMKSTTMNWWYDCTYWETAGKEKRSTGRGHGEGRNHNAPKSWVPINLIYLIDNWSLVNRLSWSQWTSTVSANG